MKKERNKKKERRKGREKKERKKYFKFKIHICSYIQQMACVYGNQGLGLPVLNSVSP